MGGLPTIRLNRAGFAWLMLRDWRAQDASGRTLAPKTVFSSNGQALALAQADPVTGSAMAQADYIHADGMPIVLASRLLTRRPLPGRIATTDFFHDAARIAAQHGLGFYFLGGTEDENRRAVNEALRLYPRLIVTGRRSGYWERADETALVREIADSGTDVLWVNLGRPKQELFCLRYKGALTGVTWLKTCGGLFGFLAGTERRAPAWMQHSGLEWLYRLWRAPRRLGRRYLTTNLTAAWLLLTRSGK